MTHRRRGGARLAVGNEVKIDNDFRLIGRVVAVNKGWLKTTVDVELFREKGEVRKGVDKDHFISWNRNWSCDVFIPRPQLYIFGIFKKTSSPADFEFADLLQKLRLGRGQGVKDASLCEFQQLDGGPQGPVRPWLDFFIPPEKYPFSSVYAFWSDNIESPLPSRPRNYYIESPPAHDAYFYDLLGPEVDNTITVGIKAQIEQCNANRAKLLKLIRTNPYTSRGYRVLDFCNLADTVLTGFLWTSLADDKKGEPACFHQCGKTLQPCCCIVCYGTLLFVLYWIFCGAIAHIIIVVYRCIFLPPVLLVAAALDACFPLDQAQTAWFEALFLANPELCTAYMDSSSHDLIVDTANKINAHLRQRGLDGAFEAEWYTGPQKWTEDREGENRNPNDELPQYFSEHRYCSFVRVVGKLPFSQLNEILKSSRPDEESALTRLELENQELRLRLALVGVNP